MDLTIRSYRPSDADALARVFFRAVHEGAAARYSAEERTAWLPEPPDGPDWHARLAHAECVVAETAEGPVGFMSLVMPERLIDLAFVLPKVMGSGVAARLYAVVEGRARAAGIAELTTEASLLAQPFFARQGWSLVRHQRIERAGVVLRNAVMTKRLDVPASAESA